MRTVTQRNAGAPHLHSPRARTALTAGAVAHMKSGRFRPQDRVGGGNSPQSSQPPYTRFHIRRFLPTDRQHQRVCSEPPREFRRLFGVSHAAWRRLGKLSIVKGFGHGGWHVAFGFFQIRSHPRRPCRSANTSLAGVCRGLSPPSHQLDHHSQTDCTYAQRAKPGASTEGPAIATGPGRINYPCGYCSRCACACAQPSSVTT